MVLGPVPHVEHPQDIPVPGQHEVVLAHGSEARHGSHWLGPGQEPGVRLLEPDDVG